MIVSFRHKGLQKFFETDNKAGIKAKHIERLQWILSRLDDATTAEDADFQVPVCTR